MKVTFLSLPRLVLLLLVPFALQPLAHAQTSFAVGQKVDAGGAYRHKATVLKAEPPSYFLHYDDGSLPDGWEQGYSMRPRTNSTPNDFAIGQKVDAGGGYLHKATVLKAAPPSYFLHYDDGSLPDGWEASYSMRPRTGGTSAAPAGGGTDTSAGPRNGKYSIYVYGTNGRPMYNGYFVLSGGRYEVFLPGGKAGGSGQYRFAADSSTIQWVNGPFANRDWDGTQKFEVDGNNQKIRLRRNTVGWSTGS